MSVADDIERLAHELRCGRPALDASCKVFPTGAVWLDVRQDGRLFVLAFLPSHQSFGVDEARPEDGIGTDFRYGFSDLESAKKQLLTLLNQAHAAPRAIAF